MERLWTIVHNFWKASDRTDDLICDIADSDFEFLNALEMMERKSGTLSFRVEMSPES